MAAYAFTDVTFEIDNVAYTCSVSRAEFTNTPNILESPSLCGPLSAVGRTRYNLELEGLQDWFETVSLAAYLFNNEGIEADVEIVWTSPDETDTVTATATVRLVASGFGGTGDELATFAVTLPVTGAPTITPVVGS